MQINKSGWPLALLAVSGALGCVQPAQAGQWLIEIQSSDGKVVYPVRLPVGNDPIWDDANVVPSSTYPWNMPPGNGELQLGAMNLGIHGETSGSEDGTNTWDGAPTPQNKNTQTESSGTLKIICRWRAANRDGETGEWIPDASRPSNKLLLLTVRAQVWGNASVNAPTGQPVPGNGAVTIELQGLGSDSDTIRSEQRVNSSGGSNLWKHALQEKEKYFCVRFLTPGQTITRSSLRCPESLPRHLSRREVRELV